ncbi:hypothetical protein HK102_009801 [Quaeritorhiza haematococci]|nr:hypothetical protein HK102_009801 [Quaeritorhiza haematococci]
MLGLNTSGANILKKGFLSLKKGFSSSKRYVVLCAPTSVDDIQTVYAAVFNGETAEGTPAFDPKSVPSLGNIAFAAVKGSPLLIILPQDQSNTNVQFVHFSEVVQFSDEVALATACNFTLHTVKADIRFAASTSTDYQDWMKAVKEALVIASRATPISSATGGLPLTHTNGSTDSFSFSLRRRNNANQSPSTATSPARNASVVSFDLNSSGGTTPRPHHLAPPSDDDDVSVGMQRAVDAGFNVRNSSGSSTKDYFANGNGGGIGSDSGSVVEHPVDEAAPDVPSKA